MIGEALGEVGGLQYAHPCVGKWASRLACVRQMDPCPAWLSVTTSPAAASSCRRNDIWGARDAGITAWLWGADVASFEQVADKVLCGDRYI